MGGSFVIKLDFIGHSNIIIPEVMNAGYLPRDLKLPRFSIPHFLVALQCYILATLGGIS